MRDFTFILICSIGSLVVDLHRIRDAGLRAKRAISTFARKLVPDYIDKMIGSKGYLPLAFGSSPSD